MLLYTLHTKLNPKPLSWEGSVFKYQAWTWNGLCSFDKELLATVYRIKIAEASVSSVEDMINTIPI